VGRRGFALCQSCEAHHHRNGDYFPSGGTPRCWARALVQEKQKSWKTTADRKTFLARRLQRRFFEQLALAVFTCLVPFTQNVKTYRITIFPASVHGGFDDYGHALGHAVRSGYYEVETVIQAEQAR